MLLASFPSPDRSVWDLGPVPIRAYALCIILGIVAAIWIGERRWVARGGKQGTVSDIAVWAVIFGLVGGRLYHVITDNELYFRAGRDPWRALYVWEGGLGVWGAIALGGVGAWIALRRRGMRLPPFADAVAPGIAVAQGIGRWGNYFNQELFGKPTDLPWAVEIDPDRPSTVAGVSTYHPTFLYESIWDLGLAGVLIWADRRFRLGRGRVFALYVMGYTVGRVWIELLRIDTANEVLGLRVNVWTSIVVFAGGLAYFLLHPGPRETVVEPGATPITPDATATADTDAADETDSTGADQAEAAETGTTAAGKTETAAATTASTADPTDETGETGATVADAESVADATADATAAADGSAAADGAVADAESVAEGTVDGTVAADEAVADEEAVADGAVDGTAATTGDGNDATVADEGGADETEATVADTSEATAGESTKAAPDKSTSDAAGAAEPAEVGGDAGGELTAEEQVAADADRTDEPLTVERARRRLLPAGRRKR